MAVPITSCMSDPRKEVAHKVITSIGLNRFLLELLENTKLFWVTLV